MIEKDNTPQGQGVSIKKKAQAVKIPDRLPCLPTFSFFPAKMSFS